MTLFQEKKAAELEIIKQGRNGKKKRSETASKRSNTQSPQGKKSTFI